MSTRTLVVVGAVATAGLPGLLLATRTGDFPALVFTLAAIPILVFWRNCDRYLVTRGHTGSQVTRLQGGVGSAELALTAVIALGALVILAGLLIAPEVGRSRAAVFGVVALVGTLGVILWAGALTRALVARNRH